MVVRRYPLYAEYNFKYRATLSGVSYTLRFRYSERNQMLYLDIFDDEGASVILGSGVVPYMYLRVGEGYFTLNAPSQISFEELPNAEFVYVTES